MTVHPTPRRAVGTLAATAGILLLTATPALAQTTPRYEGEDPGPPMSVLTAVLVFAGIPLAVFAVVVLLVLAPSWTRSGRYRPGMGWFAEPLWVNGPSEPDAGQAALLPAPVEQGGGASARW